MKTLRILSLMVAALALGACDDDQSYANLLNIENQSVNNFLADQTVEL